MRKVKAHIPVIDIFAGPGGLGEGFSSLGHNKFRIALSIEKDPYAHSTLLLRSIFRHFIAAGKPVPDEYYNYLRKENKSAEDFDSLCKLFPDESEQAHTEALKLELGIEDPVYIDAKIKSALRNSKTWVLIGGPPCQAYSLAGRSRNKGVKNYTPEKDHRHFLYEEYLRILHTHKPSVFIMENVRGILSSRVNGNRIFNKILADLQGGSADNGTDIPDSKNQDPLYKIYSLTRKPDGVAGNSYFNNSSFLVKSEEYGIPQSRHRVVLLGIRSDLDKGYPGSLTRAQKVISASDVLEGLPKIRSSISNYKGDDTQEWFELLTNTDDQRFNWLLNYTNHSNFDSRVVSSILRIVPKIRKPRRKTGKEFIKCNVTTQYKNEWYIDKKLGGVCNHVARGHMKEDLHRYLFASCYAKIKRKSPILKNFPEELLPAHKNVSKATGHNHFADRFRVQRKDIPSTTITSHISKDGHYYIHYDPFQCRSLTVREAARLQTFPDNYFFCGPRTQQYIQVGNAVPPLLALQIANKVWEILNQY